MVSGQTDFKTSEVLETSEVFFMSALPELKVLQLSADVRRIHKSLGKRNMLFNEV